MKLGIIKNISRDDLARAGGEMPKWLEAMLSPLNDFIEKVGSSLQNKLTFEDNFLCKRVSLEFATGEEKLINPKTDNLGNLRAIGVLILSTGGIKIDKWKWRQATDSSIGVTIDFDGGTSATCTVLILLGE